MKKIITLLCFVLILSSCTEDINLKITGGAGTIVIDGNIENGKPATVIVTRNSPVSEALDFTKILVTDAKVYVSDGIVIDTLTFTIDSSASIPFAYMGSKIIGNVGGHYFLTVIADGNTYTSQTTIPALLKLDSVWWAADPPHDDLGFMWARLKEPKGMGNAYKMFTKRPTKDRRFISVSGYRSPPTFDDKYIDGKDYSSPYTRGIDPTSTAPEDTQTDKNGNDDANKYYFKKSDTIYVRFCTIDNTTFRFYLSLETALQNNGNPFASPTTIKSNINGGGIGIWAGFGATYDTIYPKP